MTVIISGIAFFLAALVHGSIGFGFPMIATPLLALFTDLQTAIILTLVPTVLVNLISIRSEGNFLLAVHQFRVLALMALLGSVIGTYILIYANSEVFKAVLAFAILIYLLVQKVQIRFHWVYRHPVLARIIFGLGAGVLGGLTNVMAPVLIVYALESRLTKSETIQAANICFLSGKLVQLVLFGSHGKITQTMVLDSTLMLLVTFIALYLGGRIKNVINLNLYTKLLKLLLLVVALSLLLQLIL